MALKYEQFDNLKRFHEVNAMFSKSRHPKGRNFHCSLLLFQTNCCILGTLASQAVRLYSLCGAVFQRYADFVPPG